MPIGNHYSTIDHKYWQPTTRFGNFSRIHFQRTKNVEYFSHPISYILWHRIDTLVLDCNGSFRMYSISVVGTMALIKYFHETNWKSMFMFIFWIINNVVMETSLFLITIHGTGFFVPKMLWWYQIWHNVNKTWAFVKFVKANVVSFNRECSMINDMMSSALSVLFLVSSFCQHNLWKMRIKNCFKSDYSRCIHRMVNSFYQQNTDADVPGSFGNILNIQVITRILFVAQRNANIHPRIRNRCISKCWILQLFNGVPISAHLFQFNV